MKKLLALIIMIALPSTVISQNNLDQFQENGKYGYKNDKGEVVIPAQYDYVGDFWGKITRVKLDGKWGFVDKRGTPVTDLKYDSADDYLPENDRAWIMSKGKVGFIDGTGKEIVAPKYDGAGDAFAYAGLEYVQNNHKYGLINNNGVLVVSPKYDSISTYVYWKENRIPVSVGEKWGYIDTLGNVRVPFSYDEVDGFSQGYATVRVNYKTGFINQDGIEVIPPTYDKASEFVQSLSLVQQYRRWGAIDTSGKIVIPIKYEEANFILGDELLISLMEDSKWGVVNAKGATVLEVKYDSIYVDHFRLAFKLNGKSGYLSEDGKEVWNKDSSYANVIILSILFVVLLVGYLLLVRGKKKKGTPSGT